MAFAATACAAGEPTSPVPGGRGAGTALAGHLITIAARPDGRNVVESLDLASGAREVLWETGPEVTDWRVAPAGERAAYRAGIRSPRAAESIEVRELAPGALPRVVATVDPDVERIAGHAFAADGGAVVYARQSVGAEGGVALWRAGALPGDERRADNDRLLRALDRGGQALAAAELVAWSSTTSRAVLREDAPDGGPVEGALFSTAGDASKGAVRSAAPGLDAALAVAPDASGVAWLPRDGGAIVVDDGEGGARAVLGRADDGWPAAALFDRDGVMLAWQVNSLEGGAAWARLVDVRGGGQPRELRMAGQALVPLAFAPDGAWLLLGVGAPEALDPVGLVVADVATGALAPLAWPPPAGMWGAAWVP